MKTIYLLPVFFLLPFFAYAQNADSAIAAKEVDSLIQLSRSLTAQGAFDQAIETNVAAEKIALEKFGRESIAYGDVCYNRGRVNYFRGDAAESEKWNLESKSIREKVLGREHPDFMRCLNILATLSWFTGNFEKAESLFLEGKMLQEKVLGKEHPDYAISIGNLGALYAEMGNYEKAEPLLLESNAIREKTLGKEHPDYTAGLKNLANVYSTMGNIDKAEQFLLETIALEEKIFGKENPDYAMSLSNLAVIYRDKGDFKKAESLYMELTPIQEKVLGKEHPEYATSLNNMAVLYADMSAFEKAEQLYTEAKDIREKTLGKEHPDYAKSLHNLGDLYKEMGDFEKALPLYLESAAILRKVLGTEHPDYARSIVNLAILYESLKQFTASEPLLNEYFDREQLRISHSVAFLSERELAKYSVTFQDPGNWLSSFLCSRPNTQTVNLASINYDYALFHKGFLLTAANRLNSLPAAAPETAENYNQLKVLRRMLAAEYSKPVAERGNVAELEDGANALEKELSRTVEGFADAIRQVNYKELQSALKQDEAAIEFVHFKVNFPKRTDSTMYAALLLRADQNPPSFIPLVEEKQLAALLDAGNSDTRNQQLAGIYTRSIKPVNKANLSGLYALIWQPLDSLLKGVNTIYFSPSGLLHRINHAAIPLDTKGSLSERFRLVQLGSTRSLAIQNQTHRNTSNEAILYGGIRYEMDANAVVPNTGLTPSATSENLPFTYAERSLSNSDEHWSYLPGTQLEVKNIHQLLLEHKISSQNYTEANATEESFKSIGNNGNPSPRILHIATHGFFFPDPKSVGSRQMAIGSEPVFKISDHPMIRSGLLLAGANHAWKTGKPLKPGMEDGILTAYEISQMNLSNTELVVLSACETGLGDIQGNEGVYGLQRAFKIAGAKYLIMSLWQVPDKQTSLLMTTFYKKWLEQKMTIPEAFRAAQKELRDAGLDPYQWAGFVLVE